MHLQQKNSTVLAFIVAIVYVVVGYFGLTHHELWLDEANTYLSVRDTHGLEEFYNVFRYEGNPLLWFILVKFITTMGCGVEAMQVSHLLLMAGAIYILWKFSPFKVWEKLAISLGYFFMYEYSMISRNYALGILLLFVALVLFERKKFVPAVLVCLFCFQTHLHFFLLSLVLSAVCIVFLRKQIKKQLLGFLILIIFLGIGLLYLQIKDAGEHGYFQYTQFSPFSRVVIQRAFIMPLRAFFPIGDPISFSRDGNLILSLPRLLILIPALIAFVYPFFILKRNKLGFVYYAIILVFILFLSCMSAQPAIQIRHCGTIWLGFLVALWVCRSHLTVNASHNSYYPNKFGNFFLYLSFGIHIYMTSLVIYMDIKYPFSEGKNVAQWITENCKDEFIVCGHHFNGPPISVYLNREFYYPERKETGTYCLWNTNPFMISKFELKRQLEELMVEKKSSFILVLNDPKELPENNDIYFTETLISFNNSIVSSENFYLYKVHPAMP